MTELLYRVTPEDTVLGAVERAEAHRDQVLHRSGVVFLRRSDQRVLLQHRSPEKPIFPDRDECSAAFHVTFDEAYEQAAERELREETGIRAPVRPVGKFLHRDPPEYQIVAVFVSASDAPVRIDPSEASSYAFRTKGEVDRIVRAGQVTPWLREGWPIARPFL